jgi:hypothetical protein
MDTRHDTNMDTGHDTDIDTLTPIIIWANDITQCNHVSMSDIDVCRHQDTPNPRSVCASQDTKKIPIRKIWESWSVPPRIRSLPPRIQELGLSLPQPLNNYPIITYSCNCQLISAIILFSNNNSSKLIWKYLCSWIHRQKHDPLD